MKETIKQSNLDNELIIAERQHKLSLEFLRLFTVQETFMNELYDLLYEYVEERDVKIKARVREKMKEIENIVSETENLHKEAIVVDFEKESEKNIQRAKEALETLKEETAYIYASVPPRFFAFKRKFLLRTAKKVLL